MELPAPCAFHRLKPFPMNANSMPMGRDPAACEGFQSKAMSQLQFAFIYGVLVALLAFFAGAYLGPPQMAPFTDDFEAVRNAKTSQPRIFYR
jgi:hypothetical protein